MHDELKKSYSMRTTAYKYGFNGKENDNEVKGDGNSLDFGARIYDSRLGRFLSIDPKYDEYADLSPYSSMADNPIITIDPDGRLIKITSTDPKFRDAAFSALQKLTNTKLALLNDGSIVDANKLTDKQKLSIVKQGVVGYTKGKTKGENKPIGTALVQSLLETSHEVKITNTFTSNDGTKSHPVNETVLDSDKNGGVARDKNGKMVMKNGNPVAGPGTGSTIYFDPTDEGKEIYNEDLTTGRPSQIGLAHELGHAAFGAYGLVVDTWWEQDLASDPDIFFKIGKWSYPMSQDEINVREKVDTRVRLEQNWKPRRRLMRTEADEKKYMKK